MPTPKAIDTRTPATTPDRRPRVAASAAHEPHPTARGKPVTLRTGRGDSRLTVAEAEALIADLIRATNAARAAEGVERAAAARAAETADWLDRFGAWADARDAAMKGEG